LLGHEKAPPGGVSTGMPPTSSPASPCIATSIPSVARNGGTPKRDTSTPFTAPTPSANRIASPNATATPECTWSTAITLITATSDPPERSRPPVMITIA
jgi:hypothetical protein